jgi:hypothetical protein
MLLYPFGKTLLSGNQLVSLLPVFQIKTIYQAKTGGLQRELRPINKMKMAAN